MPLMLNAILGGGSGGKILLLMNLKRQLNLIGEISLIRKWLGEKWKIPLGAGVSKGEK